MDTPRWFLSWTQLGSAGLTWTHLRSTAFRRRRGGCNNNPLALGGKETKDDGWRNYWTPASFESLKNVCFLRWENEIMQVVRGRMRLHADSDAISTTPPRPLHFNVGLDEAPHVQEDKIMQVNIEMWGGGSSSEIEEVSSTLARCFSERSDNLRNFVRPLRLLSPCSANSGRKKRGRAGELEPKPLMDTPRWFLSSTQLGSAVLTWTHLRWADLHGTGLLGSGQLG